MVEHSCYKEKPKCQLLQACIGRRRIVRIVYLGMVETRSASTASVIAVLAREWTIGDVMTSSIAVVTNIAGKFALSCQVALFTTYCTLQNEKAEMKKVVKVITIALSLIFKNNLPPYNCNPWKYGLPCDICDKL